MARQIVVLALVFVAIVGLVSAQSPAEAPKPASKSSASPPVTTTSTPASSPDDDDFIGATDGPSEDTAVEAPLGGPVSADAFGPSTTDTPKPTASGATTLEVSAIAGVAAVAGFFF